jgi:hypothetical protein
VPFQNDDPRSAHSLKVLAPAILPKAGMIISGDTKCPHSVFLRKMKMHPEHSTAEGFFLRHPRQAQKLTNGEVFQEFEASKIRLGVKPGQRRYEEIALQERRYHKFGMFEKGIDVYGRLLDSKCLGFAKPGELLRFSCVWNCELSEYSMREQLSFDFARKVANKALPGKFAWIDDIT